MALPDFVEYEREDEYLAHFERAYVNCIDPIKTCDGIVVKFFSFMFKHACYESTNRRVKNKEAFALERAKRIDWIRVAIESENAEVFESFHINGQKRRHTLLVGKYLVVIQIDDRRENEARFITAFPHDNPNNVRRDPQKKRIWPASA